MSAARPARAPLGLLFLAALLAAHAPPVRAGSPRTIAVLPFDNWSGSAEARAVVEPAIATLLAERGYDLIAADAVERAVARERVREASSLRRGAVVSLAQALEADLVMIGALHLFAPGSEATELGISAYLIEGATGRMAWGGVAGLAGQECEGFLRLGRITERGELARRTVEDLLHDLPRAGASPAALERPTFGVVEGYPARRIAPAPRRVAVLPFENRSERMGAARIATEVITIVALRGGVFELALPGDVRAALAGVKAPHYRGLEASEMAELGRAAGVDGLIFGSVERWTEGLRPGKAADPDLALCARLVDARSGRLVWMGSVVANGGERVTVLDVGRIRCMTSLVERTGGALLESMERVVGHTQEAGRP